MDLTDAMTIKLDYELPEYPAFPAGCRRAPRREAHRLRPYARARQKTAANHRPPPPPPGAGPSARKYK